MLVHSPAVLALVACGCGGLQAAPTGADSIGTIEGGAFVVRSASSFYQSAIQPGSPGGITAPAVDGGASLVIPPGPSTYSAGLTVGLSTQSGTECGLVHGGAWALAFYISSGVALIGPGTYPVGVSSDGGAGSFNAFAFLHAYGLTCADLLPSTSSSQTSGTITLTSNAASVVGTFDVTIDHVHLAGRFDAIACDPDGGIVSLDYCK